MAQAHSYKTLTPTTALLDPAIANFFAAFYAASDTATEEGHHGAYVEYFTPEAVLVMASKRAVGSSEILETRKGMWRAVESRLHTPRRIFVTGDEKKEDGHEVEVMLYGEVEYGFREGAGRAAVDWSARAILVRDAEVAANEGWRMRFYQVYLDTAAMKPAK